MPPSGRRGAFRVTAGSGLCGSPGFAFGFFGGGEGVRVGKGSRSESSYFFDPFILWQKGSKKELLSLW